MKRKRKARTKIKYKYFYAAYRGDQFIVVGTLDEISIYLGKKRESVRSYAKKAYHERIEDYENSLLVYKYEIDEETKQ